MLANSVFSDAFYKAMQPIYVITRGALLLLCVINFVLCLWFLIGRKNDGHMLKIIIRNMACIIALLVTISIYAWSFGIPIVQVIGFDPGMAIRESFNLFGVLTSSGVVTNILLICLIMKINKQQ